MKAVVTGGAGFIGHHLVSALVTRGDEVTVLDNFSSGHRARLADISDRVAVTDGTVLDPQALDEAFTGCDVVFHHAALVSAAQSLLEPQATVDVNERGTIEVMLAASRNGVRRVVFAGSSAVYGDCDGRPCHEDRRADPRSPYGVSKLAAEHYVHALGASHGLDTVVLRYFNVFGPGQDPASQYAAVIPRFITSILARERPVINGIGTITRDFVYVDDVVRANLIASTLSAPSAVTCNIATGSPTSLQDLLGAVCQAAGYDIEPTYGPPRPGDILHSRADVSLAARVLGFQADVSLEEGIARTVDWYRLGLDVSRPGVGRSPHG